MNTINLKKIDIWKVLTDLEVAINQLEPTRRDQLMDAFDTFESEVKLALEDATTNDTDDRSTEDEADRVTRAERNEQSQADNFGGGLN